MEKISNISQAQSVRLSNMSFLCSVFVVLMHCGVGGITTVAVPYFFLIAGYFLAAHVGEHGWWQVEVGKRVRSLLIPLWIWGGVNVLMWVAIKYGTKLVGYEFDGDLSGIFPLIVKSLGFNLTVNMGPLWFIRMLFILVAISPALSHGGAFVSLFRIVVFGGAFVGIKMLDLEHGRLWHFLEYGFSLKGLFFFAIGIHLRRFPIKFEASKCGDLIIVMIALAAVVLKVDYLLYVPIVMYGLYRVMPTHKVVCNGYSFPIYLMHLNFLLLSSVPLALMGIRTSSCSSVLISVARALFAVLGSMGSAWLMRRYCPWVAKIVFGGR